MTVANDARAVEKVAKEVNSIAVLQLLRRLPSQLLVRRRDRDPQRREQRGLGTIVLENTEEETIIIIVLLYRTNISLPIVDSPWNLNSVRGVLV